ncbi:hypothetical protein D3C87_2150410 [compost metagenome]
MMLVSEGMLAIQAGSAPHLLQERLEALSTVKPKRSKADDAKSTEPKGAEDIR